MIVQYFTYECVLLTLLQLHHTILSIYVNINVKYFTFMPQSYVEIVTRIINAPYK